MSTVRRIQIGVAATGVAAYAFLPSDLQTAMYLLISVSTPGLIIVGVRRHRPVRRAPWYLISAGFAMYALGDLIYRIYENANSGMVPSPNVGDLAYYCFYVLVLLGLGQFLRVAQHRDRTAWLDASIWMLGAALLAWKPMIGPYFAGPVIPTLEGAVGLAYPLFDIVLMLMVLRVLAGQFARAPAFWLLLTGVATQAAADVIYGLQILQTNAPGGLLLDLCWLSSFVAVGAAAMHPSMRAMTKPSSREVPVAGRVRLVSLVVPMLVAPALLLYALGARNPVVDRTAGYVVACGAILLVLLVVARGAGLLFVVERRSGQLIERQAQLEAVLVERERAAAALHLQVNRDALTGLASRDRFVSTLHAALLGGGVPSVAFIDLDDFKTVNDTMGHEAGDLLLVDLAARLQATVGTHDLVARFGGDEFAVLVKGDVEQLVEQLLIALQPPFLLHGRELRLQVSIGVTTADADSTSTGDMLRRADIAMYTAKRAGGGWARYLTGMSALLRRRMDLRARLVDALRDDEITPWYQPIVDIGNGELRGFEALARWTSRTEGVLTPDGWMPMAEETGLVVAVDRAVSRAAVAQLAAWRSQHVIDDLYLSINMSARTLQQAGVAEWFLALLAEYVVPANRVVVEVTESVLIDDERVSARLQVLRAAGVRVALDDFGTGWSSLSYLQRFPVDQLKLDRSFSAELTMGLDREAIPAAVVQLARALALDVVAEGVERIDQLERLRELGFHRAQGYLFGQAEPPERLGALLALHGSGSGSAVLGSLAELVTARRSAVAVVPEPSRA